MGMAIPTGPIWGRWGSLVPMSPIWGSWGSPVPTGPIWGEWGRLWALDMGAVAATRNKKGTRCHYDNGRLWA
jgi:hypothetical protein